MPLLKRMRVLAAAVETTPGTAVALSASDAQFCVYNIEINANITVSDRMGNANFGMQAAPQEGRGGSVSFTINPYLSGGAAPAWAATFLPACGLVQSGTDFDATAEAPGSNVKTLTIGVYEDGVLKVLRGCAGDLTFNAPTGKMGDINFTFTGIWTDPTDASILSPSYPTDLPMRSAGATTPFSWGSWQPCLSNFSLSLGNNVILRECQTDDSGYKSAIITDRNPTGNFDPESTLVADYDYYGDWKDAVERALAYSMDDANGSMTWAASVAQITNIQEGDRNGIQIDTVDFRVNDDSLSLNFT